MPLSDQANVLWLNFIDIEGIRMCPFKSDAQRKYLFSQKPEIAKEFAAHTPRDKKLPLRVKKKKTKKR